MEKFNEKQNRIISWQAHRGGGAYEAPDNTMAANRYAWGLGGIPENDVRATKDGVIICLHDETPARTTTAPDAIKNLPVSCLTFEEIRKWDAGVKFNEKFAGEKIPSIEELFTEMKGHPEKMAYLDLKNIDLKKLGELIDAYRINSQIVFTHNVQENCIIMKDITSDVRTMQWIGGKAAQIKNEFDTVLKSGFKGLDQVQIHLNANKNKCNDWLYEIDVEFLKYALTVTKEFGVELEVLPFELVQNSINQMLDIGIDWYATDEPARFLHCLSTWRNSVK